MYHAILIIYMLYVCVHVHSVLKKLIDTNMVYLQLLYTLQCIDVFDCHLYDISQQYYILRARKYILYYFILIEVINYPEYRHR